jgi:glycosyltransferase involved in cell wall biosynthesis
MLADFRALAGRLGLADRVHFTGEVPHAEVPAYFARGELALLYMSDRLVNGYRCSLKLREYFAAGLKVVCNDYGELADFADWTYQTGSDVQEFAAMILRVFNGHDDGRQRRAQAMARAELDWPRIIEMAAAELARRVGLAPPAQIR